MTTATQSTKVVRFADNTSETWDLSELASYVGMPLGDLKPLKAAVVGQMVQMKRDAEKSQEKAAKAEEKAARAAARSTPSATREKQSELYKFRKKATGNLADSFKRYLREQWITQQVEKSKEQRDRTDQNMDSYGEKVLAVLYEMGLLESEFEQLIRDTLKDRD